MSSAGEVKPQGAAESTPVVAPVFRKAAGAVALVMTVAAVAVPVLDFFILRIFQWGIPGATPFSIQAVLVLAFAGAVITSLEGDHLALTKTPHHGIDTRHRIQSSAVSFLTCAVEAAFVLGTLSFALLGFDPSERAGFVPYWIFALALPAGFVSMLILDLRRVKGWPRAAGAAGALAGIFLAARAVVINKLDLAPYLPVDIERLRQGITIVNPDARVFPMSCLTGEGLTEWLAWLRATLQAKRLHGAPTPDDTSGACGR